MKKLLLTLTALICSLDLLSALEFSVGVGPGYYYYPPYSYYPYFGPVGYAPGWGFGYNSCYYPRYRHRSGGCHKHSCHKRCR